MLDIKNKILYLIQKNYKREDILKLQQKRFYKLLCSAYYKSPFYHQYYNDHHINEKNLKEVTVSDLPLMNKKILMDNLDNIFTDRKLNRHDIEAWIAKKEQRSQVYLDKYYVMFSSGTSLNPSLIVFNNHDYDKALAFAYYRILESNSFVKEKIIYLSSSAAAIVAAQRLSSIIHTNMLSLSNEKFDESIELINKFNPNALIASPSFLALIFDHIKKGTIKIHPNKLFLLGESAPAEVLEDVKSFWGIEPIDVYGAAETTTIGYRKSVGDGYTIFDDFNIFEVLDDKNNVAQPGSIGRAVITNLINHITPIIRYDIGDKIKTSQSASDSPFLKIQNILGRTANALLPMILNDGNKGYVHPAKLDEFYVAGMKKCQFIFKQPNCITINYVSENEDSIDEKVQYEFNKMLVDQDENHKTIIKVKRLESLMNDPNTGNLFQVRVEKF